MQFDSAPPPSKDTFEISLFGTGVGEGMAIHLGDGDWALVDTCRGNAVESLSLSYLESMGVDVTKQVKYVIATHWHDDHVNGLSEIVRRCHNSVLVFSSAVACDEFRQLVVMHNNPSYILDKEKSGVREMGKILQILKDRKQSTPDVYRPSVRAQADLTLHKGVHCTLHAISPSPGAVEVASEEIAKLWATLEREASGVAGGRPARGGVPSPERNHNAIALWLRWGDRRILLGSDLEESGDRLLGWQAVLTSKQFPDGTASIFKIAHHGSPNGDYGPVWDKIIDADNPIAILTAYSPGVTGRPAPEDIERINLRTNKIYFTTLPKKAAKKYPPSVEKTISGVVKNRKSLEKHPGQIRIRWPSAGDSEVQLFGAAGTI